MKLKTHFFFRVILLAIGWLAAMSAALGQPKELNLDSCISYAIRNYPLIKKYDLISEAEQYNLSNASKVFLPQFSATVIAGLIDGLPALGNDPNNPPSNGADFNVISLLQLNQPIWDGGRTKAQKSMINAQSEIARAEIAISSYSIKRRVQDIYFGMILLNQQDQQLKTLLETLTTNRKRVENALSNGVAYQSDLDEIDVEILEVEKQIISSQFARQAYRSMLSYLTGSSINDNVSMKVPEGPSNTLDTELARPEMKQFQNQRKLIEANSDFTSAGLYPTVGLTGIGVFIQPGADLGPDPLNNLLIGGVSLSWDIGTLYRNSNSKKLTQVDLEMVNVQQESFEYSTGLNLTKLKEELKKFDQLLAKDEEVITLQKRLKVSYEKKYENGVVTLPDLLTRINNESIAIQNRNLHELQKLQVYYHYKIEAGY